MAPVGGLTGRRILVAEDEFFIADEVVQALEGEGALVIGPAPTVAHLMALLQAEDRIDGAVLDVNLNGEMVWPAVAALLARGVPVLLATGYDAAVVPADYGHLPRCAKPVAMADLTRALTRRLT
jgi:DNA-binding NtrC family response regulator